MNQIGEVCVFNVDVVGEKPVLFVVVLNYV